MTRKKTTSRVTSKEQELTTKGSGTAQYSGIPSLRVRRPFMFWAVVVGTLAMVLSVVATFASALFV